MSSKQGSGTLMRWWQWAPRLYQWLIYRHLNPDQLEPDQARRIRYTYNVLMLLTLVGLPFFWRAVQWQVPERMIGTGLSLALAMILLFANPQRKHIALQGYLATGLLMLAVITGITTNGGPSGPAMGWLAVVALVGGFLNGLRAVIIWTGASISVLIIMLWLEQQGFQFSDPTPPAYRSSQRVLQLVGSLVAVYFVLASFMRSLQFSDTRYQHTIQRLQQEVIQRRDAEQKALQANQSKNQFLANMTHELRTPMNAIIGLTQLTLDTELAPQQENYLKQIEYSSLLLLGSINDILDLSKIEAGRLDLERTRFHWDNLTENLAALFGLQAEEKNLCLLLRLDAEVPRLCLGDPIRLSQVITNLLANAIKFTQQGQVSLDISVQEYQPSAVMLCVQVRDTGIGIDAAARQQLFRPFVQGDSSTTRRYGGTGLGLVISKRLVELMEGAIGVTSEPGSGTEFTFTTRLELPAEGDDHRLEVMYASLRAQLQHTRVLVIHQHYDDLSLLLQLLGSFDIKPDWVEAAHLHSHSQAFTMPPDLIVAGIELRPQLEHLGLTDGAIRCLWMRPIAMVTEPDWQQAERHQWLYRPLHRKALGQALAHLFLPESESNAVLAPASMEGALAVVRVLLVEDNTINQQVGMASLTGCGADVTLADHGAMALERIQQQDFDIVLMDVQMPIMDGYSATREIRKLQRPRVPIIAMTAHVLNSDIDACMAAGMDDYLPKPVTREALVRKIREWVP